MLENLRYSVDGARDGMGWAEDKRDRQSARERQAQMDRQAQERYGMQLQEHQQDRAIAMQDREEFELPEKRARADQVKTSANATKRNVRLMRAYAQAQRGDLSGLESFYADEVPDGYSAKLVAMPDGRVEIQHPKGRAIANNIDEVVFGKEDGTGMGLYQMANPEQAAESVASGRKERTKRKYEIEDDERQNTQRIREIDRQRAPMPQYGLDAEGNQVRINGTRAEFVTGPDGKPMRGSISGRGGIGRDTRTALQKNLEYRAQLAIARDRSGALADMDPIQVAGMVEAMDQAGKSRSERMKAALSMMNAAYSDFEDTAAITARASALVDAVGQIAGAEPSMRYGLDDAEPAPDAGAPAGRKVVRRGTAPDGTRVVMYDDGSIEADL